MLWKAKLYERFPKAARVGALASRLRLTLWGLGIETEHVLFANALCRDELCTPSVRRFSTDWGENFSLAGLGGYPSAGRTGAEAYAAHLPAGGTLLILYGPHIGISSLGEFGVAERPGKRGLTPACGALLDFQRKIQAQKDYQPSDDPLDIEQAALEHALLDEYQNSKDLELIDVAFKAVQRSVLKLFPIERYPSQVMIGGILINTPQGFEDYFEVQSAIRTKGTEVNDLLTKVTP